MAVELYTVPASTTDAKRSCARARRQFPRLLERKLRKRQCIHVTSVAIQGGPSTSLILQLLTHPGLRLITMTESSVAVSSWSSMYVFLEWIIHARALQLHDPEASISATFTLIHEIGYGNFHCITGASEGGNGTADFPRRSVGLPSLQLFLY